MTVWFNHACFELKIKQYNAGSGKCCFCEYEDDSKKISGIKSLPDSFPHKSIDYLWKPLYVDKYKTN